MTRIAKACFARTPSSKSLGNSVVQCESLKLTPRTTPFNCFSTGPKTGLEETGHDRLIGFAQGFNRRLRPCSGTLAGVICHPHFFKELQRTYVNPPGPGGSSESSFCCASMSCDNCVNAVSMFLESFSMDFISTEKPNFLPRTSSKVLAAP